MGDFITFFTGSAFAGIVITFFKLFYQDKNSKRKTEFDSLIDSLKMFKERLAILEHKIELQEKALDDWQIKYFELLSEHKLLQHKCIELERILTNKED